MGKEGNGEENVTFFSKTRERSREEANEEVYKNLTKGTRVKSLERNTVEI